MELSSKEVRYIARLARLRLSPEEEKEMAVQLGQVIGYVEKLRELDTEGLEPMSHVLELSNVSRPDISEIRISHEEALKNAPETDGNYFRVPKVID